MPRGLFSKSIKRVTTMVHSRAGITTPMKTVNSVIKALPRRGGREKDDYDAGNKNIIARTR